MNMLIHTIVLQIAYGTYLLFSGTLVSPSLQVGHREQQQQQTVERLSSLIRLCASQLASRRISF